MDPEDVVFFVEDLIEDAALNNTLSVPAFREAMLTLCD
jgi:hypothetical protein